AAQLSSHGELCAPPAQALTSLLANLEEQSLQMVAQDDPGNWARQALNRVMEWVGARSETVNDLHDWRKTRLSRALVVTSQKVAEEWDQQLSRRLFALMEHAGARVAVAEAALARVQGLFQERAEGMAERLREQAAHTAQAWRQIDLALQDCLA